MASTTSSSTIPGRLRALLERRKYEFLLAALMQHLFIAVLLPDLAGPRPC